VPVVVFAIGADLAAVDGHPDATDTRLYDISLTSQGQVLETFQIYSGGLMGQTLHQSLVYVPQQAVDVSIKATYRYDSSQAICVAAVNGNCAANLPIDPTNSGWSTQHGTEADLVVAVSAKVNGTRQEQTVLLPVVGQLLGIVP
jgi:hypothetical protein